MIWHGSLGAIRRFQLVVFFSFLSGTILSSAFVVGTKAV
jgi:hypothetical protein